MAKKAVIFDFDGTVADTLSLVVALGNRLAEEFGYQPVSQAEVIKLRDLSSWQIIKHSGVSIFKLPFVINKLRVEMQNEIGNVNPFPGIKEVLKELKKQGYCLGIITSNVEENAIIFLEKNELLDLFDFIYSGAKIFGKSKAIAACLAQQDLLPENAIYVGDETRDIQAAKKAKIKAIAATWGFNSRAALVRYQPDFVIDRPEDLLAAVSAWQQCASAHLSER